MKLLTLAVAIALLGIFGCDEPNQMMQQVTRETGKIGETGETGPTTGDVLIGDAYSCPERFLCGQFSYTNMPGDDNTGRLTIYVEIPEALGDGLHTVHLTYDPTKLETDIPNQQLEEFPDSDFKRMVSTFFLKRGDTIVFNYKFIGEEPSSAGIRIFDEFRIEDPAHEPQPWDLPVEWDETLGYIFGTFWIEPVREEPETQEEEPAE